MMFTIQTKLKLLRFDEVRSRIYVNIRGYLSENFEDIVRFDT